MVKNIAIAFLAALVIVFGGLYISANSSLSGASGQDHYNAERFYETAKLDKPVLGNGILVPTANATTTTLTAAQVCSGNAVKWSSGASATATLPSAEALVASCLSTAGNRVTVVFTSSAATTTYSLAAATGTTVFGNYEVGTTTKNMVISSSTPVSVTFLTTLASSTDSTVIAIGVKSLAQ